MTVDVFEQILYDMYFPIFETTKCNSQIHKNILNVYKRTFLILIILTNYFDDLLVYNLS